MATEGPDGRGGEEEPGDCSSPDEDELAGWDDGGNGLAMVKAF